MNDKNMYSDYMTSNQSNNQDSFNEEASDYQESINLSSNKRKYKLILWILAFLIIVSLGVFALVYTGVVKVNYVSPKSIILDKGNISIKPGKDYQYDYQVYPEQSSNKNVYYESSDPKVIEVNEVTGYVTAKKEGTAEVIVKSLEDKTIVETSKVVVTKENVPIEKISLSSKKLVFDLVKSSYKMLKVITEPHNATNKKLDFYSSDSNVAIVDQNGNVKPVGYGTAIITVSTKDGSVKEHCEVVVTNSETKEVYFTTPNNEKIIYPYDIKLEFPYIKMRYGTTRWIDFKLLPPDVTEDDVTWISSNPDVVSVKDGLLTANTIGEAIITAITLNDLVATLSVSVTDEIVETTSIAFKDNLKVLELNETTRLHVKYDAVATVGDFKWESSDLSIVKVFEDGVIKGVKPGKTTVTVTTNTGLKATIPVEVLNVNSNSQKLLVSSVITMNDGESHQLEVYDEKGYLQDNLIYVSSNSDVVKVNDNGVLIATGPGEVVVKITNLDGISVNTKIIVKEVETTRIEVEIDKEQILNKKETSKVEVTTTVYPPNSSTKDVDLVSSNEKVIKVENNELVVVGEGKTEISAVKKGNNIKLTSKPIPIYVTLEGEEIQVEVDDKNISSLSEDEKNKIKKLIPEFIYENNTVTLKDKYDENGYTPEIKNIQYIVINKGDLNNVVVKEKVLTYDTNKDTKVTLQAKITLIDDTVIDSDFFEIPIKKKVVEESKLENVNQSKSLPDNIKVIHNMNFIKDKCYSISDFIGNNNVEYVDTNLKSCGVSSYVATDLGKEYYLEVEYNGTGERYEGTTFLPEVKISSNKDVKINKSIKGKSFKEIGIDVENKNDFEEVKDEVVTVKFLDDNKQLIKEQKANVVNFSKIVVPYDDNISEIQISSVESGNPIMIIEDEVVPDEEKSKCSITVSRINNDDNSVIYLPKYCDRSDIDILVTDNYGCLNSDKKYDLDLRKWIMTIWLNRNEEYTSNCIVEVDVKTKDEEDYHTSRVSIKEIKREPNYVGLNISFSKTSIKIGETAKLVTAILEADNIYDNYVISSSDFKTYLEFSSSDKRIVEVSNDGVLTPKRPGNATITIQHQNYKNLKKTIEISVTGTQESYNYVCYGYKSAIIQYRCNYKDYTVLNSKNNLCFKKASCNEENVLKNQDGVCYKYKDENGNNDYRKADSNLTEIGNGTIYLTSSKYTANQNLYFDKYSCSKKCSDLKYFQSKYCIK